MKYIFYNFNFLKILLGYKNIGTKVRALKAANNCRKTFNTCSKINNKENTLHSRKEGMSWLSSTEGKTKRAEDVIPKIIAQIEAKPIFFKCVHQICEELRLLFPSAEITLFGSSGSNLALENSDADISMFFKETDPVNKDFIKFTETRLQQSRAFISTISISARVPIIKCVHSTKISCDISFSNHLGAVDSSLIRFILCIDNRIRPLILMLKFLLKKENLLFNTHCLVVMTVFFLQVLENPLVPPISYLQDLATKRQVFEGWDVSFTRNSKQLPVVNNQLSVIELLQKFFQFYAAFEFALEVISVFTAKSYFKPYFTNTNLLPQQFHLYKRKVAENESFRFNCKRSLCIQGFFDHSNNIGKNCLLKQIKNFQDYCRINAEIGHELVYKKGSEDHKLEFLIRLFQGNKIKTENQDFKGMNTRLVDAVIVLENICLNKVHLSEDDYRKEWWDEVLDKVLVILRDVMKCDVSITSSKTFEDEWSNVVEEYVLSCNLPYWGLATKLRREAQQSIEFPANIGPIARQKIISDYLEADFKIKDIKKQPIKFDMKCIFEKRPTRVRLKFEPKRNNDNPGGFLFQVCSFLRKNIPKWVK